MKETATLKLPYPETTDDAKVPAHIEGLAKKVEEELLDIPPAQLADGASGQIIVVGDTGTPAYKALSGDATINAEGVLQLGSKVVGTAELADKGVTTAKLDDGAGTSAKVKPTTGTKQSAIEYAMSGAYEGELKLEITPAVASILSVTAIFDFRAVAAGIAEGTLAVDGAAELAEPAVFRATAAAQRATVAQVYSIALSAAAHTVEMRFKSTGTGIMQLVKQRMLYLLTAS